MQDVFVVVAARLCPAQPKKSRPKSGVLDLATKQNLRTNRSLFAHSGEDKARKTASPWCGKRPESTGESPWRKSQNAVLPHREKSKKLKQGSERRIVVRAPWSWGKREVEHNWRGAPYNSKQPPCVARLPSRRSRLPDTTVKSHLMAFCPSMKMRLLASRLCFCAADFRRPGPPPPTLGGCVPPPNDTTVDRNVVLG